MNTKEYTITYNDRHQVVVRIDHDVMTEAKLHEINSFWSDDDWRVRRAGSVLHAVLKMLAAEVLRLSLLPWGDVVDQFNRGVEGWPPMDGSEGIELVRYDEMSYDADDMEVEAS
jgi:hypothetical protein